MSKYQDGIGNLLASMSEQEQEAKSTYAQPRDLSESLSPHDIYLLCLSRVLTGPHICTAISYDRNHPGEYLVSNNAGRKEFYDAVVGILAIGNSDKEGMSEKLKVCLRASSGGYPDTQHESVTALQSASKGKGGAVKAPESVSQQDNEREKCIQADVNVIVEDFDRFDTL